jgi:two-component system sensor histidine kinase KdpD
VATRASVSWSRILLTPAIIAVITALCYQVFPVNATTAGFAYLVGILAIAAGWGLIEALIASIAAMFCFSFFFLPPVGRFAIADPENLVALFTFLATALVASHLSDRSRKQTQDAKARQQETEQLYALSRAILLTEDARSIGFEAAQNLALIFGCRSVAIYDAATGEVVHGGGERLPDIEPRLKQAAIEGAHFEDPRSDILIAAAMAAGRPIGSLALSGISLSDDALRALLNLVAIALERVRTLEAAHSAEAARHSQEFKSTLLDAITHEFKTPLTSIKAAATTILTGVNVLCPQVRELTSIIDEEANRLNLLVTDAVRMAQIEASKIQLERQPVAVKEFVDRVLGDFGPRFEGRKLNLTLGEDLPSVSADPDLASMALRQVVDNCLKYSPPASPLAVAAHSEADRVTIRVRDQGPGIPEREHDRVFDRFYRRRSAKDRAPGSGLGLYIAREIIRAHGGDLWVENALGAGSEFCLTLPKTGGIV